MYSYYQGPYSSYSYDFTSLTVTGGSCALRIGEDSVNCVSIDDAAEEQHQRLMVAASVSLVGVSVWEEILSVN